jgi:hypothetical protein
MNTTDENVVFDASPCKPNVKALHIFGCLNTCEEKILNISNKQRLSYMKNVTACTWKY